MAVADVDVPAKKAASKPRVAPEHPTYQVMIAEAINALKERGGSSRAAILKYVCHNFKVEANEVMVNSRVKFALKAAVIAGGLKQTKGTGASGSFQIGAKSKQPKVAKAQKQVVKTSPAKTKSPKNPVAKKVAKVAKSPKKLKKTATPKSKAASPKKSAVNKSATLKKAATYKSGAKNAAAVKNATGNKEGNGKKATAKAAN